RINTIEPLWWALFFAGAGVVGLVLPIHIFMQGVAIPLGWVPHSASGNGMRFLLTNPIIRLYLFAVISLAFFHWAHRFRYFVYDLGIRGGRMVMAVLCYGAAILGTIYAAVTLIGLA
ncbi:MAG TPA: fumarate reductase subunit FrdD, partial [Chloroflexota bacterium]